MAVRDYSSTPASNTTIAGTNIDENCSPGGINNAIRQIMADVRVMYDNLPDVSAYATKAAAVFSGTQPIYTGRGAFLHHNNSANSSGRVFVQASGDAAPSMSNGDWLAEY